METDIQKPQQEPIYSRSRFKSSDRRVSFLLHPEISELMPSSQHKLNTGECVWGENLNRFTVLRIFKKPHSNYPSRKSGARCHTLENIAKDIFPIYNLG